jgi:hypothetical protein
MSRAGLVCLCGHETVAEGSVTPRACEACGREAAAVLELVSSEVVPGWVFRAREEEARRRQRERLAAAADVWAAWMASGGALADMPAPGQLGDPGCGCEVRWFRRRCARCRAFDTPLAAGAPRYVLAHMVRAATHPAGERAPGCAWPPPRRR